MKIYGDSFYTIHVNHNNEIASFNVEEIFDSVSFIRLSSDAEATIGAIDQIIFLDSVLILRDGYTSKSDLGLSMRKEDNPIITFFYPKQF